VTVVLSSIIPVIILPVGLDIVAKKVINDLWDKKNWDKQLSLFFRKAYNLYNERRYVCKKLSTSI
jgi:hypothetical protein